MVALRNMSKDVAWRRFWTDLKNDLNAIFGQNTWSKLGPSVRLPFVSANRLEGCPRLPIRYKPCVCRKDSGSGWRTYNEIVYDHRTGDGRPTTRAYRMPSSTHPGRDKPRERGEQQR